MKVVQISLVLGALCFLARSEAQPSAADWDGVYRHEHVVGTADDGPARAENILEIVSLGEDSLYVRIRLEARNGHFCKFYGVAQRDETGLVHRGRVAEFLVKQDPSHANASGIVRTELSRCELSVVRKVVNGTDRLVLSDTEQRCRQKTCGANAYLDGASWDVNSQRPIRYMQRLKASSEYAEALSEARLSVSDSQR